MFDDIVKSFKATMYERATSPLLGSFIIFWIYFNWRAISILLFGSDSVVDRIIVIDKNHIDAWVNLWFPLIYASIFSTIYPYISVVPYTILRHANSFKVNLRNRIEKTTTISVEEFNKLKKDMYERDMEISSLINQKTIREDELNEKIKTHEDVNKDLIKDYKNEIENNDKYNIFIKEYELTAKNKIENFVEIFKKQLNNSYSNSFSSFCVKNTSNITTVRIDYGYFQLLSSWLEVINVRTKDDVFSSVIDELSEFIRVFVRLAENVRYDIKISIRDGGIKGKTAQNQKIVISDMKEEWNLIQREINNIVDSWRIFIKNDYFKTPYEKDIFIDSLKSIEEE